MTRGPGTEKRMLTRRELIRLGMVGAGVIWAAPVLTRFSTPASAAAPCPDSAECLAGPSKLNEPAKNKKRKKEKQNAADDAVEQAVKDAKKYRKKNPCPDDEFCEGAGCACDGRIDITMNQDNDCEEFADGYECTAHWSASCACGCQEDKHCVGKHVGGKSTGTGNGQAAAVAALEAKIYADFDAACREEGRCLSPCACSGNRSELKISPKLDDPDCTDPDANGNVTCKAGWAGECLCA